MAEILPEKQKSRTLAVVNGAIVELEVEEAKRGVDGQAKEGEEEGGGRLSKVKAESEEEKLKEVEG